MLSNLVWCIPYAGTPAFIPATLGRVRASKALHRAIVHATGGLAGGGVGPQKITDKVPSFVKDRDGTCLEAQRHCSLKPARLVASMFMRMGIAKPLRNTSLVRLTNLTSVCNGSVLHWLSQTLLRGA